MFLTVDGFRLHFQLLADEVKNLPVCTFEFLETELIKTFYTLHSEDLGASARVNSLAHTGTIEPDGSRKKTMRIVYIDL